MPAKGHCTSFNCLVFCGFVFWFFFPYKRIFMNWLWLSVQFSPQKAVSLGEVFLCLSYLFLWKKTLQYLRTSCLSAIRHWNIIQENILAAMMVAPYAVRSVRSRVHFTVAGYLCWENHEGSRGKWHCEYFHCSVYLEDLRINTAFFFPDGRLLVISCSHHYWH